MAKNNLFITIAVASLCTFTCYGKEKKDYLGFSKCLGIDSKPLSLASRAIITTLLLGKSEQLNLNPQNTTNHSEKLPIMKFPQPRSLKTGYGLAFLPQDSLIKRNLKSLCKDLQNIEDLKVFARYLENVHHIGSIDNKDHSIKVLPGLPQNLI